MNISRVFFVLTFLPSFMHCATTVFEITDDFYMAEKMMGVKGQKNKKTVYFSLERIKDKESFIAWKDYQKFEQRMCKKMLDYESDIEDMVEQKVEERIKAGSTETYPTLSVDEKEKIIKNTRMGQAYNQARHSRDAIKVMGGRLEWYDRAEVWVAYASDKKPAKPYADLSKDEQKDFRTGFQMSVVVITKEGAPFQLHMGIFRNLLQIHQPQTEGLSLELHGFAAKAMLMQDPNKKFMITTPLRVMLELLRNNKKLGPYCMIGSNNDQSPIHVEEQKTWTSWIVQERFPGTFELFSTPKKEKLIWAAHCEEKNCGEADWFFNNATPANEYPYVTIPLDKLAEYFTGEKSEPMVSAKLEKLSHSLKNLPKE